jgi:hypothetical protein
MTDEKFLKYWDYNILNDTFKNNKYWDINILDHRLYLIYETLNLEHEYVISL